MKRIIMISLAILLMGSLANAQLAYDAYNGPMSGETIPVYSAGALDVGDVVVWATSLTVGSDAAWVASASAASTSIVAGVVYPAAIGAGSQGSIVIYGYAQCDTNASGIGAMSPMCTTATAGAGAACVAGTDDGFYAVALETGINLDEVNCFVRVK